MKKEEHDALVAAQAKRPAWPTAEEAKTYLMAKGYVDKGGGTWALPSPDHQPTAKQAACLAVLKVKPVKAHGLKAEAGGFGAKA